ncbi:MAG: hypothetical protein QM820_63935 [Minicystis sp.]
MSNASRRVIGTFAFGLFAWLLSIVRDHQGPTRAAIGALAGASLMIALHLFASEVRGGSGRARGGGAV